MLIALAFSAVTLFAQSSAQGTHSAATEAGFREAVDRLAAESPDVAREYEDLASVPFESRSHRFAVLPSSMKSSLWTHHLLMAVTKHSEFTGEQRALIYEAIRLLSPDLYDTVKAEGRSSPALEVVHDLTERAQLLFSRDVARTLFVEIGSAVPIARGPEAGDPLTRESTNGLASEPGTRTLSNGNEATPRSPHKATPSWGCSCSTVDDWCRSSEGNGWYCQGAGCTVDYSNCGTFLLYDCTGICVHREPE